MRNYEDYIGVFRWLTLPLTESKVGVLEAAV